MPTKVATIPEIASNECSTWGDCQHEERRHVADRREGIDCGKFAAGILTFRQRDTCSEHVSTTLLPWPTYTNTAVSNGVYTGLITLEI